MITEQITGSIVSSAAALTILIVFVKLWASGIRTELDSKQSRSEANIHVSHLQEEIKTVNAEVKVSFDKLYDEMKEQIKTTNGLTVEVAKLTQRVDDLLKNGNKALSR